MRRNRWFTIGLIACAVLLAYFFTRLTNLTILPIFTDEAIYIRWSQIGSLDANWRFISLVDGKQPMFTWIMMVLLRFIRDPLVAGRLVSVMAGFFTMTGLWFVSFELFRSKKVSFIVSVLYVLSPFALVYDRVALYDSLVAAFYVWNFYLAILLVRHVRLDIALILGLVLGAGMLNKSSGFLSLYLLPSTLILFDFTKKNWKRRLAAWFGLALIAALLSQMLYAVLRLSPLFHMVGQKDAVFIYPFREWIKHPFNFVIGNLRGEFDWLFRYMTIPIAIASFVPIVVFWKNLRTKLLLFVWWIAPFVALALFARVLYPRFILFMVMPLYILASLSISWITERFKGTTWGVILLVIALMPSLYADYYIITNPRYAPLPYSDKTQLVDSWPSGWGVKEVNTYLAAQAEKGKIAVYTDGTFGLLPYAVEIYLVQNPNVKIKGIWPLPKEPPQEVLKDAAIMPTYVIFNLEQTTLSWPMRLIAEYPKGNPKGEKLRLFQIELSP